MFLVVGLGNIGDRYKNTRHNIGFRVIDKLVDNSNAIDISKTSFFGKLYKSKQTLFLKPSTFMNLSGKSVSAVKNFYKLDIESIIVIHDDIDLPFSALRFKRGGGSGGHNGLKSIDSAIGKDYIRVRMGVGKPEHKGEVVSFVLSNFSEDEERILDSWVAYVADTVPKLQTKELNEIKSKYSLKLFQG
jgi:PTH1 family peptidyl-tRNA hydrolase